MRKDAGFQVMEKARHGQTYAFPCRDTAIASVRLRLLDGDDSFLAGIQKTLAALDGNAAMDELDASGKLAFEVNGAAVAPTVPVASCPPSADMPAAAPAAPSPDADLPSESVCPAPIFTYILLMGCKAAAPMIPFMTEEIYRNLVCSTDGSAPESIHLCDFPTVKECFIAVCRVI